jgi:hypothetical protein
LNRTSRFIIGGGSPFDGLVIGRSGGDRLVYVARVRKGFTPALRSQIARQFAGLEVDACPFAHLPEAHSGRWGQGSQWRRRAFDGG